MTQEMERIKILELLENGKISSAQATELLQSLSPSDQMDETSPGGQVREYNKEPGRARWMRVRVSELSSGKNKVNLVVPIAFLKLGTCIAGRHVDTREDSEGLVVGKDFLKDAVKGNAVDVSDPQDDERVEISFL